MILLSIPSFHLYPLFLSLLDLDLPLDACFQVEAWTGILAGLLGYMSGTLVHLDSLLHCFGFKVC